MVVEVLPDVSGIDRTFAYEVPEDLAGKVEVGCIVRVLLHGRRVRGWVVAKAAVVPPDVDLHPLRELVSLGPPPLVVDLCRWAAWRYSGRLRPLLVAASPPCLVRVFARGAAGPGTSGEQTAWGRCHGDQDSGGRDSRRHRPGAFLQPGGPEASTGGAEACRRGGGRRRDGRQCR